VVDMVVKEWLRMMRSTKAVAFIWAVGFGLGSIGTFQGVRGVTKSEWSHQQSTKALQYYIRFGNDMDCIATSPCVLAVLYVLCQALKYIDHQESLFRMIALPDISGSWLDQCWVIKPWPM